jgi:hypothetical protein
VSSLSTRSFPKPSSPIGTILGNRANEAAGESTVAVPSRAGEGADSEVYVADTTWEERTWKELVKLKEDMFWAGRVVSVDCGGSVVFCLRFKTVGPAVDWSAKRNTSYMEKRIELFDNASCCIYCSGCWHLRSAAECENPLI